jgi:hypothetical protein
MMILNSSIPFSISIYSRMDDMASADAHAILAQIT